MATFFTDFSEYTTGNNLQSESDWSLNLGNTSSWTQKVLDEVSATGGKVFEWEDNGLGNSNSQMQNDVIGSVSGENSEIVVRVKTADVSVTNNPFVSLVCQAAGANYTLVYKGSGLWKMARALDSGSLAAWVGAESGSFTPSNDTYFWIRMGRVDSTNTLRFSVGATESDVDPSSWDESAVNSFLTVGHVSLQSLGYPPLPIKYDICGIGTGADSAPTSGGGGATELILPPSLHSFATQRAANY